MSNAPEALREVGEDAILPFQVQGTPVRGRIVRLGAAIDTILGAHGFEPALSELVGEAAALAALMGSALKFEGKLIFQAQGDGPVSMLVADYAAGGSLRATAKKAKPIGDRRGLRALMGSGHIALTIDQGADMERYQGVTKLDSDTLAAAAIAYFDQSEQIPTAIRLAVGRVYLPDGTAKWRAGGIMIQFVPGEGGVRERGEAVLNAPEQQETWDRARILLETTQPDELVDPSLSAETLLWRLYHEDGVLVFTPGQARAACTCDAGKIARVLERYNEADLAEMVEAGFIRVSCEFCRREYLFDRVGAPV